MWNISFVWKLIKLHNKVNEPGPKDPRNKTDGDHGDKLTGKQPTRERCAPGHLKDFILG